MAGLEERKTSYSVTCTAPVNIAVVKYWGKRQDDLVLPINDSLSATLSQEELCAKTTVMVSKDFEKDQMWLNGVEQSLENPRLKNIIKEMKRLATKRKLISEDGDTEDTRITSWKLHICSKNNFPTAAGLASSAAGYACLVYALSKVYGVSGDISSVARMGSGSACRSTHGGFVAWNSGTQEDGCDSQAEQVADELHWPQMRIIILVVSDQQKDVGSTTGMKGSVDTSDLLTYRAQTIVPRRMKVMRQAILDRDFETFARETMKDSNQLHAICQDTYPPIFYMNEYSRMIVNLIHKYNQFKGSTKVAYTFDAGPSACLYLLEEDVPEVMGVVNTYFPTCVGGLTEGASNGGVEFSRGLPFELAPVPEGFCESYPRQPAPGALKYIISTKVGDGPRVLTEKESLLSDKGQPKISLLA